MYLNNDIYEFIKGEIAYLYSKYDLTTIPINGFELARKMNIKLIPYNSLNKEEYEKFIEADRDSLYMEYGNIECIAYNDEIQESRLNMSILHEIGHCVLDHSTDKNYKRRESEAKFFAKYAIAPLPLVHQFQPTCLEDIENIFHTSSEASMYIFNNYKKWLSYSQEYKDYEIEILNQFGYYTPIQKSINKL